MYYLHIHVTGRMATIYLLLFVYKHNFVFQCSIKSSGTQHIVRDDPE
jgi:hypothetical protein